VANVDVKFDMPIMKGSDPISVNSPNNVIADLSRNRIDNI
jgi:hypothetical protein